VVGPDNALTLLAGCRLADWTGEAGGPGTARDQYAELLPFLERLLGGDHPCTRADRAERTRRHET
jgi:hypothetical protein